MKMFSLDKNPCVIPEVIAESITKDKNKQTYLCNRARRHFADSENFRRSFKGKDEREVLGMWFKHWIK